MYNRLCVTVHRALFLLLVGQVIHTVADVVGSTKGVWADSASFAADLREPFEKALKDSLEINGAVDVLWSRHWPKKELRNELIWFSFVTLPVGKKFGSGQKHVVVLLAHL